MGHSRLAGTVIGCLVLALASAGCLRHFSDWVRLPASFRQTMKSQEAEFYLPLGWCGGIGTPMCDAENEPLRFRGQPVFYTGDFSEFARESPDDSSCRGYRVRARIHIENRRGTNRSLPPAYQHEEDYHGLVIEEVLDVRPYE